jgi:hypothetical protein
MPIMSYDAHMSRELDSGCWRVTAASGRPGILMAAAVVCAHPHKIMLLQKPGRYTGTCPARPNPAQTNHICAERS